jgi:hypothetical protein
MSEDLRKFLADQATTINLIKQSSLIISKVSVTLQKTRRCLFDLKTLRQKIQYLHSRITIVTTAKDRKKLSYFLQDYFFAAEDAMTLRIIFMMR